jgi:hypothetical protein
MLVRCMIIALLLVAWGCNRVVEETAEMPADMREAYKQFNASAYLRGEWEKACVFPLDNVSYLMLIARVEKTETGFQISCYRGGDFEPLELSDVMPEWEDCGIDPGSYGGLAELVYNETHWAPYPLVHLGGVTGDSSDVVWVLVKNCHWLHEEQWAEENIAYCQRNSVSDCRVKSAAYALLDERGIVYW